MKRTILSLLSLFVAVILNATTLYTPNGKSFTTYDGGWGSYNADFFEAWVANNLGPGNPYPNSEVVCEWENGIWEYNCHVFAWNNWQGAERWGSESDIWKLGKPSPYNLMWRDTPDVWHTDSDNPIGIVSYISSTSNEAAICTYSGNHSARIVGDGTYYISKWGSLPIVKHPPTEVPLSYGSVNTYYKINPAYRPIGAGDPAGRNWETISNALNGITSGSLIAVLSGTQNLTGNISIPSGVTLTIKSGTAINFSSYYIITDGGTIIVESGVTNYACLKNGGTIKGLFPTVNSALSVAQSGETIEVVGTTSLASSFELPSSYTILLKQNSTLNMNGYNIVLTGGTVNFESGSSLGGLKAYLKYYSTLKGYYDTISSAISDAGTNWTVELLATTYNENISVSSESIYFLITLLTSSRVKAFTDCGYSSMYSGLKLL